MVVPSISAPYVKKTFVLLVVITIWMITIGQGTYHQLRRTLGIPFQAGGKDLPAQEPAPIEESYALIAKTKPGLMTLVGDGGFVVIIWLMMFKPF